MQRLIQILNKNSLKNFSKSSRNYLSKYCLNKTTTMTYCMITDKNVIKTKKAQLRKHFIIKVQAL